MPHVLRVPSTILRLRFHTEKSRSALTDYTQDPMCTRPELHLSFIHQFEVFVSAALGNQEYQAGLFILSSALRTATTNLFDPFLLHFFRGPQKNFGTDFEPTLVQNVIANKF